MVDFVELAAGVRTKQAVRAFVNATRADEAAARERGCGYAAHTRPSPVHTLVPGAVSAMFGHRRRRAAGESLRKHQFLRAEVE
jgi:hypothetical protein